MTTGNLSIQDNDTVVQYTAVGESTFVFPFPILENDELKVSKNQVLQIFGADYSITGLGDEGGGYITLLAGPSTPGDVWTLWQDMPIERLTGFSAGAATILGAALNAEFAARLRVEQQLRREIRNSLRLPPDDPIGSQDMVLPINTVRAGRYLAFDAQGRPYPASGTGNDSALRTDLAATVAAADGSRLSGYRRNTVGSVARSVGTKLDDLVNVLDWGTTQAALQAAADYAEATGAYLIAPPMTVTLTSTLVLNCKGDLSMMTVEGASQDFTPMVRVGTITGNPTQLDGELRLPRVNNTSKPGAGWASQQVGIELANLYESEVYVPYVFGFDVGLDCGGYTSGFAYNNVHLGQIVRNKRGVRLQGKAGVGWANQNQFYGGRIWIPSAEGSAIAGARYLLLTPTDIATDDQTWPNNNTFVGTSCEAEGPEYQAEIAGANNLFLNCRWEHPTTPQVKLTGHASQTNTYENCWMGGINVTSIAFTESGIVQYNGVVNARSSSIDGTGAILNLRNAGSSANPLIQGFEPAIPVLNRTNSATDWSLRVSANSLQGKASGDANAQVDINFPNGLGQFRRLLLTSAAFAPSAGVVMLGNSTQTTVGAAGGASALPATPSGYLRFFIGATEFVLPYYARA